MRTTFTLDDELVAKAQAFTGIKDKSALVREALKALIEREALADLARLGGGRPRRGAADDGERHNDPESGVAPTPA